MSGFKRITLRLVLASALCGAVLFVTPAMTAGFFAEGDDDIPGIRAISPIEGTFSDPADLHDVFGVNLREGEMLKAVLLGSSESDIDLGVLEPDAETVEGSLVVECADRPAGEYPLHLTYLATESGTHYLDVYNHEEAEAFEPAYTLFWSTEWPGDRDAIPGPPIRTSPFTGTLEADIDQDDVYQVYLAAGEQLDVELYGSIDRTFELYLFPPGTESIDDADRAVASSSGGTASERLTYLAPASGAYYLDVYARSGCGAYRIEWSRKAAVGTPVVASAMALGRTYRASGSVSLRQLSAASVARLLAYRLEGGKWVLRRTQAASVTSSSGRTRYSAQVRLPYRGKWRIRAYHRDAKHAPAYSAFRYVTVR